MIAQKMQRDSKDEAYYEVKGRGAFEKDKQVKNIL